MRRLMLLVVAAIAALVVSGAAGTAGSAQAQWVVTDLGTLGGGSSEARALNERGQVVGGSVSKKAGQYRAFVWQKGKMQELGVLPGGVYSWAAAVNDRGQVVGASWSGTSSGGPSRAFVWQNGKMTYLGKMSRRACSNAAAISDSGKIVGWSGTGDCDSAGSWRAALWQAGRMVDLGKLAGWPLSQAVDVNERGQVVGYSYGITGQDVGPADYAGMRSFVWQGGKLRDLGVIPGLRYTEAVAINDRGQVVGTAYENGPPTWKPSRAFVWQNGKMKALSPPGTDSAAAAANERGQIVGHVRTKPSGYGSACLWQSGQTVDLGTPPGEGVDWLGSYATSLNDHGQIVGVAIEAKGNHAFVWEKGQMTLLPTLGGASSDADAVNEHGQIIGNSETQSGESHAVLWTLRSG